MSEERTNAGLSSSALLGALVEWTEDRRPMPDTGIATMYPEAAFDMALVTKEKGVVEQVTRTFWGTWKALVRHGESFTEINVNELRILSPNIRAELRKLDDETFPEDHPLPRRIAMTDHPITPPPRLADAALADLGPPLVRDDFVVLTRKGHATIRAALNRLKELEESSHA